MVTGSAIFIFLIVIFIGFVISIYNRIIQLRENIYRAFANIDVLLKQRFDEVPNLERIVKGYAAHEKELMQEIADIRSKTYQKLSADRRVKAANELENVFLHSFAVFENYPQLQANDLFLSFQKRLSEIEEHIANRREFYNECVRLYNTQIEQIPDVFVARLFRWQKKDMLTYKVTYD